MQENLYDLFKYSRQDYKNNWLNFFTVVFLILAYPILWLIKCHVITFVYLYFKLTGRTESV